MSDITGNSSLLDKDIRSKMPDRQVRKDLREIEELLREIQIFEIKTSYLGRFTVFAEKQDSNLAIELDYPGQSISIYCPDEWSWVWDDSEDTGGIIVEPASGDETVPMNINFSAGTDAGRYMGTLTFGSSTPTVFYMSLKYTDFITPGL